jgi:single-strand DNA-binding protein
MANYNKIILVGNLTRDPQMSYLPSQTPVVEFGLAVNRNWKDRNSGERREETCFIDCRAYGRTAETINQYMSKGRQILVEGRLQFDTWEGKDGTRRSKHRVFVENFQFLGGRGGSSEAGAAGSGRAASSAPEPPPPPDDDFGPPVADDGGNEQIPF